MKHWGIYKSLIFTGLIAIFEKNLDLLSEVCIAMKYANLEIPRYWQYLATRKLHDFYTESYDENHRLDRYHEYLMSGRFQQLQGGQPFRKKYSANGLAFIRPDPVDQPLHTISIYLHLNPAARHLLWNDLFQNLHSEFSADSIHFINEVTDSTNLFEEFFCIFSRPESF